MHNHVWRPTHNASRGQGAAPGAGIGWGHHYLRSAQADQEARRRGAAEERAARLIGHAQKPAWGTSLAT
jgi:hypothetical protein